MSKQIKPEEPDKKKKDPLDFKNNFA